MDDSEMAQIFNRAMQVFEKVEVDLHNISNELRSIVIEMRNQL